MKKVFLSFRMVILLFSFCAYSVHKWNVKVSTKKVTTTGGETLHDDRLWHAQTLQQTPA